MPCSSLRRIRLCKVKSLNVNRPRQCASISKSNCATQKMEALGTLAGGIAHDFNNILAVILGYAELSLYDLAPGSNEWHNLQQILIASGRAKHLLEQTLAFSRQSEQRRQPVYLHFILEETLTLLRASLPSTIELRQSFSRHTGMVLADPSGSSRS